MQGGGNSIPFFLLNLLQKLYLTGHIAIAQMPEEYAQFADQLTWAMFDFPSPFERLVSSILCQPMQQLSPSIAAKCRYRGEMTPKETWKCV